MMQDCTHIRQLEGERRLLTWEAEQHQQNGSKEFEQSAKNGENHNENGNSNGDGTVVITADTKLKTLIQHYPQLKEDLPGINSKFSMLQSPMARVILPIATLKMMSEQSGMPQQELIDKLKELIATYKE